MTHLAEVTIRTQDLDQAHADLLVVPLHNLAELEHDDLKQIAKKTRIDEVAQDEGFSAKKGQTLLFRGVKGLEAPRVLFVGLGEENKHVRASVVKAARIALDIRAKKVALYIPTKEETRLIVEGFLFGSYRFTRYKTVQDDAQNPARIDDLDLYGHPCKGRVKTALSFVTGIYLARDLGNTPPNDLYPETMAQAAVDLAKRHNMSHTVYDEKYLQDNGFNLLYAVGKGSQRQPRLIHLEYRPEGEVKRTIALVGKGITFDTGGYNIKTNGHILNMHLDMGGAAAVLGAAEIIGRVKPEGIAVHFVIASAENSVSSKAYLPNDVLKGLGGKTVEIQNTDAEGRLVLADALTYIQRSKPDEIIDLATLTGACVVALGDDTAALYSNDDNMVKGLLHAASENEESLWRMPLLEAMDSQLDSKIADMRNIGDRMGGSISAALFLKRWVDLESWAHFDIAGPAMATKDSDLSSAGGTGYAVATLASYLLEK